MGKEKLLIVFHCCQGPLLDSERYKQIATAVKVWTLTALERLRAQRNAIKFENLILG